MCDIFLPDLNLIIEYFGDYWHCNPLKYDANYFNQKLKLNFRKFYSSYYLFLYKFLDCVKYNSDFTSILKLLKKNNK